MITKQEEEKNCKQFLYQSTDERREELQKWKKQSNTSKAEKNAAKKRAQKRALGAS